MSQSEISIHLILANISEKRELIRKIVQAIDYRFRPYIKCNGSSRCLAFDKGTLTNRKLSSIAIV